MKEKEDRVERAGAHKRETQKGDREQGQAQAAIDAAAIVSSKRQARANGRALQVSEAAAAAGVRGAAAGGSRRCRAAGGEQGEQDGECA